MDESRVLQQAVNVDGLHKAYIKLVATRNLSFRSLEWQELLEVSKALNPFAIGAFPDRHEVPKLLE